MYLNLSGESCSTVHFNEAMHTQKIIVSVQAFEQEISKLL